VKLHDQASKHQNAITAYGADYLEVNRQRHAGSILLGPSGAVQAWAPGAFADIDAAALAQALALEPEVLILGTGRRSDLDPTARIRRQLPPRLGVEFMDTAAACRTFNILAAEGRRVVGALVLEPPDGA
jgi:uncharacterized protein